MSDGGTASVPDVSGELARRLRAVERAVAPEEIHDLWIFPPLEDVEESAEFLLFTRRRDGDRRCVYSARVRRRPAPGDGSRERVQEITDHGTVPTDRVARLIRRFRRRLGEEDREPTHVALEGREDRWSALVGERRGGAPEGEDARLLPVREAEAA